MSRNLRKQIDSARAAYQQTRYKGDLGELALTHTAPSRVKRVAVWAFAMAASLLAVVAMLPDETTQPARPKTTLHVTKAIRLSPLSAPPQPPLLKQIARASQKSPAPLKRPVKITLSSFKPPRLSGRRPATSAVATAGNTANSQTTRPASPRRLNLSPPSLTLRSFNDAISLGT